MEEYLNVLNEDGEYTNRIAPKGICHTNGLWHKAVVLFIINSKKQVLLQKRSEQKKMWPGMWDVSSGGHVLVGEFGFEAVIRETKEELGLEYNRKDLIFLGASRTINYLPGIINKHFNEYYVVNADIDENKLYLQKSEVSAVKWVDREEIIFRIQNNKDGITDKKGCWDYLVLYYDWVRLNNG